MGFFYFDLKIDESCVDFLDVVVVNDEVVCLYKDSFWGVIDYFMLNFFICYCIVLVWYM